MPIKFALLVLGIVFYIGQGKAANLQPINPNDKFNLQFFILPMPNPSRKAAEAKPLTQEGQQQKSVAHPTSTAKEIQACDQLVNSALVGIKREKPLIGKGLCGSDPVYEISAIQTIAGKITFTQSVPLNCQMLEGLALWGEGIQKDAQKHLSTNLAEVNVISTYACRNRYNDPNQRISQHAFANAIDISGFKMKSGESISLLKTWDEDNNQSAFLKAVHKTACNIFSTVLGPESNAAHKDHFHFDMGRGGINASYKYCR